MKPAQSTTVGPVERVRGIKNKDINPVCLSLSLQGGQAQICQAASEGPSVSPETCSACSWRPARVGATPAQRDCAAAPFFRYPSTQKVSS